MSVPQKALVWLALLLGLGLVVALALAALVTLRPDFALGQVQSLLAKNGYELKWQRLDLDPAAPSLSAANLTLKGHNLDLALESLDCRAAWSNFLGGGPPLETVELKGLDLRAGSSPDEGEQAGSLDWAAWLIKARRIKAERVTASIDLGALTLSLEDLALSVQSKGQEDNTLNLEGDLALVQKGGRASLKGRLKAAGRVRAGQALWAEADMQGAGLSSPELNGLVDLAVKLKLEADNLELDSIRAGMRGGKLKLPDGTLDISPELVASGSVFLADGSMNWTLEKLSLPGLLEISGAASGPTWPLMAGKFKCRVLDMKRGVGFLKPLLPPGAAGYSASGRALAELNLAGDESYELKFKPENVSLKGDGLNTRIEGVLGLKGNLGDTPDLFGLLELKGSLAAGDAKLSGFGLKLPLTGDLELPGASGFFLAVPAGGLSFSGKNLWQGAAKLSGDAVWIEQKFVLDKLDLELAELGRFKGYLEMDGDARGKGNLAGKFEALAALKPLADALGMPLGKWAIEGSAGLKASFRQDKSGLKAEAELVPHDLGLSSPDGAFLASGGAGRIGLSLSLPPKGAARYGLSTEFGQGELLYRAYYLNLAKSPFSLKGAVLPRKSGWHSPGLDAKLHGLGSVSLAGFLADTAAGFRPDLKLKLEIPALKNVQQDILKDALAESYPTLAAMRLTGGLLAELGLTGDRGKGVSVRGGVSLAKVDLGPGQGELWARGLDLRLPVSYLFGGKAAAVVPAKADWGLLSVEKLSLPGLAMDNLQMPLALVPNRLLTGRGFAFPLFGARVKLGKLEVKEPLSKGWRAETSLGLKKLDLAKLPLPFRVKGEIGGRLEPVVLTAGGMTAGGKLTGKVFGGNLAVSRIHARPFSPGKGFGLDLKADNLDLLALTSALKAGVITGRADVSLTGFEMDYGQPVAFDLAVSSRPMGITDQLVSLEAVNSISVMGTGSGLSGLGVAVFKRLFNKFPYEKIGFRCRLNNDVFKVQGLIKDDGSEYLIKKPPLMGINVINQNPDNLIGFSDMVERLKRVMNDSKAEGDKPKKE